MRHDYRLHTAAGSAIGVAVAPVAAEAVRAISGAPHTMCVVLGFLVGWLVATMIGWAKEELYDKPRPVTNTRDPEDAQWTSRGGAVGAVIGSVIWGAFYV